MPEQELCQRFTPPFCRHLTVRNKRTAGTVQIPSNLPGTANCPMRQTRSPHPARDDTFTKFLLHLQQHPGVFLAQFEHRNTGRVREFRRSSDRQPSGFRLSLAVPSPLFFHLGFSSTSCSSSRYRAALIILRLQRRFLHHHRRRSGHHSRVHPLGNVDGSDVQTSTWPHRSGRSFYPQERSDTYR